MTVEEIRSGIDTRGTGKFEKLGNGLFMSLQHNHDSLDNN